MFLADTSNKTSRRPDGVIKLCRVLLLIRYTSDTYLGQTQSLRSKTARNLSLSYDFSLAITMSNETSRLPCLSEFQQPLLAQSTAPWESDAEESDFGAFENGRPISFYQGTFEQNALALHFTNLSLYTVAFLVLLKVLVS